MHNGSGKTLSLTKYAEEIIRQYPKITIISNIEFKNIKKEDYDIRYYSNLDELIEQLSKIEQNNDKGYLIIIDEIQVVLADMFGKIDPIFLMFLSQQRKLSIKILATSQLFSRMLKPVREFIIQSGQCIVCKNYAKVIQVNKYIDMETAEEDGKNGISYKRCKNKWFIHTKEDYLRYDTFAVISQIKGLLKGERKDATGLSINS